MLPPKAVADEGRWTLKWQPQVASALTIAVAAALAAVVGVMSRVARAVHRRTDAD